VSPLAISLLVLAVWLVVAGLVLAIMAGAGRAEVAAARRSRKRFAKLPRSGEGRNLPHELDWRRAGHRERRGGGGTAT